MFQNFFKSQLVERIWILAKIEFRQRYYEHKAGLLWALIKPIADCMIYYFVFKFIMKNNTPDYALYLFIGLICANIFFECSSGKIMFLAEKRSLYEYSNMNKIEIYFSSIMANFIGFGFNLFVLFILFFTIGESHLTWHALWLPLLILLLFIICLSWSIILSAVYLFARDIFQVWQVCTTILFWTSPIILAQNIYDTSFEWIYFIHPFSSTIAIARQILLYESHPTTIHFGGIFCVTIIYGLIAIYCLKRFTPFASEKL